MVVVYNPKNEYFIKERIVLAESILKEIPSKNCFITGSFLYKKEYNDIDIFVITRNKKEIKVSNKKAKITIIDFNDLYSLFYHSISKSCISKNVLPFKPLKVTMSDYWGVINESVPNILNQKNEYKKDSRFLVLYTEYFLKGIIFDTFLLDKKLNDFKSYEEIMNYIEINVPVIMNNIAEESYLKRFFYTKAGFYKSLRDYKAQDFLYLLTHKIIGGLHG